MCGFPWKLAGLHGEREHPLQRGEFAVDRGVLAAASSKVIRPIFGLIGIPRSTSPSRVQRIRRATVSLVVPVLSRGAHFAHLKKRGTPRCHSRGYAEANGQVRLHTEQTKRRVTASNSTSRSSKGYPPLQPAPSSGPTPASRASRSIRYSLCEPVSYSHPRQR